MTPVTVFAGKSVALFGLGGSGLATARALIAGGALVHCWDDGEAGRAKAAAQGLTVTDLTAANWSALSALILSPGVPLTHPVPHWSAQKAQAAGIEIIGDIELFFRERAKLAPGSPVVAITGTNGKSTTTALIAHVLKNAGRDVQMGGNIGTNILDLAPPAAGRFHVIEMSSFQIDLTPSLKASVGIQLNLTPDHLDRHGTLAAYAAIKERLVASADTAVIGVDDAFSKAMADRRSDTGRPLVRISASGRLPVGMIARGSRVSRVEGGEETDIASLDGIASLRGAHNAQNAAAAWHVRATGARCWQFADLPAVGSADVGAVGAPAALHDGVDDTDLGERAQGRPAERDAGAVDAPVRIELDQVAPAIGVTVLCPGPVPSRIHDAARNRPGCTRIAAIKLIQRRRQRQPAGQVPFRANFSIGELLWCQILLRGR